MMKGHENGVSNQRHESAIQDLIDNMVYVEGGTFMMGSEDKEANGNEAPVHVETVESFYIGKYEVTQREWIAVMGTNPSEYKGNYLPVTNVSWNECQKFIKKLNEMTGRNFRLPTEEEWEYAARGGKYSKGNKYSGSADPKTVAWYYDTSKQIPHNVGTKSANELGLHDMSGSVGEWTSSGWCNDYSYPRDTTYYVMRDNGWLSDESLCRVSYRTHFGPNNYGFHSGLRLACSQSKEESNYQLADFPGGSSALIEWINENMIYPKVAYENDFNRKVFVKFLITENGHVVNPEIIKGKNEDFNIEALRLVMTMPRWIPAKSDGQPVDSYYILPLDFTLRGDNALKLSNNDPSVATSRSTEEPKGMLKAFGLKGRVKELTFSEQDYGWSLYFDLNGNLLDYPNYHGEKIRVCAIPYFFTFDNWKWTQMDDGLSMFYYKMLKYDENNRPILADGFLDNFEEKFEKKNLRIWYSGSDEKGNYTHIHFDNNGLTYKSDSKSGIYEFDTYDVSIEYWPEDASAKDIPTELSENEAIRLIQQANRKDIEALTEDFKIVIEDEKATNQLLYLSLNNEEDEGGPWDTTILNYGESTNVPDIFVRVNNLSIHDSKDGAIVYFYYTELYDDGTYYDLDLNNDDYYARAIMKFENGEWKVDNITWDIRDCRGHYQDTYDYKKKAKEGNDSAKKYIQSGALEREIKSNCAKDSNMSEKLGKVVDFKIKHNLY